MIGTKNQADAFVISNVLVITIGPNIFICNKFVTEFIPDT